MFRLLYVCTANRIRSPLAVAYTHRLTEGLPVAVESAGIAAAPGLGVMDETLEVARAGGIDLSEHRCVPIAEAQAKNYDLVLAFEFQQMSASVVGGGAAPDKTFLIKEFLRCAPGDIEGGDPEEHARMVVSEAHERRKADGFVPGEDVADPVGRGLSLTKEIAREIEELCAEVVQVLFAGTGA